MYSTDFIQGPSLQGFCPDVIAWSNSMCTIYFGWITDIMTTSGATGRQLTSALGWRGNPTFV